MTNETNYRTKAGSVLFAFLMVTSMFAGSVAFAGSAAADATGVTANDIALGDDLDTQVSVGSGNDTTIIVAPSSASNYDSSTHQTFTNTSVSGTTANFTNSISLSTGSYTVYANASSGGAPSTPSDGDSLSTWSQADDGFSVTSSYPATSDDGSLDSGSTFWSGQELRLTAGDTLTAGEALQVRTWDSNDEVIGGLETEFSLNSSGVTTLDTSGLPAEDLVIVRASNNSEIIEFDNGAATN
ncbi:hypothetical protein DJ84_23495, partial [Halorubrum ezzemoulense]